MNIIDINTVYGPDGSSNLESTKVKLEDYLQKNGISSAFTLNTYGIYHNYIDGNANTLNDCKDSSNLMPVATLDMRGFFGESSILDNIKASGFKAIKFFPNIQNWQLDNMVFEEVLNMNNITKLPLIINASEFGDITKLNNVLSNFDYPIILSKVSFTNLSEAICIMKKYSNVLIETSNFKIHFVLDKVIDTVGVDRVVFGSNSLEYLAKVAIDYINSASISDSDKEAIFYSNIKKFI